MLAFIFFEEDKISRMTLHVTFLMLFIVKRETFCIFEVSPLLTIVRERI